MVEATSDGNGSVLTTFRLPPVALADRVCVVGEFNNWSPTANPMEPAAILSAAAALGRFTSREWIGSVRVPAAVVVHTRDRVVPPHRQRKLAAALHDAAVVEVDVDHRGMAGHPHRYIPALLEARASVAGRLGQEAT
jgi:pimeloyl-ACP methyl ester carboxylesterase